MEEGAIFYIFSPRLELLCQVEADDDWLTAEELVTMACLKTDAENLDPKQMCLRDFDDESHIFPSQQLLMSNTPYVLATRKSDYPTDGEKIWVFCFDGRQVQVRKGHEIEDACKANPSLMRYLPEEKRIIFDFKKSGVRFAFLRAKSGLNYSFKPGENGCSVGKMLNHIKKRTIDCPEDILDARASDLDRVHVYPGDVVHFSLKK
jgi:hypothetical protein